MATFNVDATSTDRHLSIHEVFFVNKESLYASGQSPRGRWLQLRELCFQSFSHAVKHVCPVLCYNSSSFSKCHPRYLLMLSYRAVPPVGRQVVTHNRRLQSQASSCSEGILCTRPGLLNKYTCTCMARANEAKELDLMCRKRLTSR